MLVSGASRLREKGLEDPIREARRLLILASRLTPAGLIAAENDRANEAHCEAYEMMIDMRAERLPFAHIAGGTSFYGLVLLSDSRALIPRADSECVVDLALEKIPADAAVQIADLGTGSGALLAALLTERPLAQGIAVERDSNALMLAEENFAQIGIEARVKAVLVGWADWSEWSECNLIISNPPYIRSDVIPDLAPEVRDHDPIQALDGGADGLNAYREIVELAAAQMQPGAHLVFEIGYDQKQAVSELLVQAGFTDLRYKQDLGGQDRAIAARKT
jgi:release factor glutamine methyltransferase